jgi:hypothetical protein
VLAWYDGYDENGDGIYQDWHGAMHYIDLRYHAGTSTKSPHSVRWDTTWVPDQAPGSVKLVARIRNRDGLWFVTPLVDGLTLRRRGTSVKLYKPQNIPERYWVRAKRRMSSSVNIETAEKASAAAVAVRTWNGHHESFALNGQTTEISGVDHNFDFSFRPVAIDALRAGTNTIEFHSITEHHGVEILWPGPAVLVRYGAIPKPPAGDTWLNSDYEGRFSVELESDAATVAGKAVAVPIPAAVSSKSFRVVEYQNARPPVLREGALPWQLNPDGTLTILLRSVLTPGEKTKLTIYFGRDQGLVPHRRVSVEDDVQHEGQVSLRIRTPEATWLYHKSGGGFASLFDKDANDWISYHPGNRSAGEFRGIPNVGDHFHPGYEGENGSKTTIDFAGALHARVRSESNDGRFAALWDFFPSHAQMTLLRAGAPYWFLYEGTPGGKIDVPEDFWVTSDGTRRSVAEHWQGVLPAPEWVYFADTKLPRALFVANHQNDDLKDQFWQMESNMTVWGFGREYRCCGKFLTKTPAVFTLGLLETSDYGRASAEIRSAMARVRATAGPVERRP